MLDIIHYLMFPALTPKRMRVEKKYPGASKADYDENKKKSRKGEKGLF